MSDWTPTTTNEVRADFIALHTRNFDPYATGRSLTSEKEYYGEGFDRWLEQVKAEAWDAALNDAYRVAAATAACTQSIDAILVALAPRRQERDL